jgi:aminocarboxymuconate-semialdehyde decarboxylase
MRSLFDVEGYLERQEEADIELTVLSHALADLGGTEEELEDAKAEHDFLGDLVRRHPTRFAALAGIDPFGGRPWLDEAERALDGGFAGLCFPTSRRGRYLDAPECSDALALASERQAVVFLHPSDSPIAAERAGDAMLRAWIGRPYDTGVCLSRLLLAGTLDEVPELRIVVAHSGGTLPMLLGRLDRVYDGFERRAAMRARGGPPGGGPPGGGPPGSGPPGGIGGEPIPPEARIEPKLDGRRPSERLGQLYLDTASYHPAALTAAVATVGADHVVVGTDYPPAGDSPQPTLDLVAAMELTLEERELVRSGTARRLLSEPAGTGSADHRDPREGTT